jgi:hypothetical protein
MRCSAVYGLPPVCGVPKVLTTSMTYSLHWYNLPPSLAWSDCSGCGNKRWATAAHFLGQNAWTICRVCVRTIWPTRPHWTSERHGRLVAWVSIISALPPAAACCRPALQTESAGEQATANPLDSSSTSPFLSAYMLSRPLVLPVVCL